MPFTQGIPLHEGLFLALETAPESRNRLAGEGHCGGRGESRNRFFPLDSFDDLCWDSEGAE